MQSCVIFRQLRRRMTTLNNTDSQELVSTSSSSMMSGTPEAARRPSPRLPAPRSPLVQVHSKVTYATPQEEMVPEVDMYIQTLERIREACNEKPIHYFQIPDPFLSTLGKNYFFPLKSPQKYEKSAQKWVKKAEK